MSCRSNSDLGVVIHPTEAEKTIFLEWGLDFGEAEKDIFSIESPSIDVTLGKCKEFIFYIDFIDYLNILIGYNNSFQINYGY